MELHYLNPTHTLIVAHLDAGETLGTLEGGEHGATHYVKVDGTDANYLALLEQDPQLETVNDPGEVRMPPAQEAPPAGETGATGATGAHEGHTATQHGAAKPAAPAAHAAPKPAAPAAHTAPKR